MNPKDIKQLIKLMIENDLTELEVADGETKIHLRRGAGETPVLANVSPAPGEPAAFPGAGGPVQSAPEADEDLVEIVSPMVGTLYSAPSPDSEPYVTFGATVHPESSVCIIEAMKVMNEIKADCSGIIHEICVKNAQPVEFNQVLFRVKPT